MAAQLSLRLGRTVVDKTGLSGNYAYTLRWTPDADEQTRLQAAGLPAKLSGEQPPASNAPPLLTAVQEQLGLKLQPQNERVQVLVIDHVEQPAEH